MRNQRKESHLKVEFSFGKLIQKLETDYDIDKMFLDTVRNRLYVTRPKSDDVYYLDLDEVFN